MWNGLLNTVISFGSISGQPPPTDGAINNASKTTDAVDELIVKVGHAPKKKFNVIEKDKDKHREAR